MKTVSPIDFDGWKQKDWGGRGFEIIKAPIRLFLLITTPMADLGGKEEWNKPLSVLHCITGPLFVVFALEREFFALSSSLELLLIVVLLPFIQMVLT